MLLKFALQLTGLMLQVQHYLEENPDELCEVYFINKEEERYRTIDSENRWRLNLFQGRSTSSDPSRYPGDRKICVDDKLTIQIHKLKLDLKEENKTISNVPVIAIWVPRKMARGWVSQNQGGVL